MSGADNPRGKKFWCQQKPSVTSVICYKFKKKSPSNLILYNFFHYFVHVYRPGAGPDNPFGMKFLCQQEHLVTSVIYCKFKKNLFEVWFFFFFLLFFHDFIHVYSPAAGAESSQGTKFDFNRNVLSLHSFVASFKKMSLKSDFKQLFFSWFNTCI